MTADALDLGIGFGDVRTDEDVVAEPLFQERLCLIVGKGHPAAERRTVMPAAELRGMDLALLNTTFVTRRTIDQYFHDHRVAPRVAVESDAVDSLMAIVRGGRLATVAPEAAAHRAASSRQCVCRRPSPSAPFRCCCAATPIAAPPRGPSCSC